MREMTRRGLLGGLLGMAAVAAVHPGFEMIDGLLRPKGRKRSYFFLGKADERAIVNSYIAQKDIDDYLRRGDTIVVDGHEFRVDGANGIAANGFRVSTEKTDTVVFPEEDLTAKPGAGSMFSTSSQLWLASA